MKNSHKAVVLLAALTLSLACQVSDLLNPPSEPGTQSADFDTPPSAATQSARARLNLDNPALFQSPDGEYWGRIEYAFTSDPGASPYASHALVETQTTPGPPPASKLTLRVTENGLERVFQSADIDGQNYFTAGIGDCLSMPDEQPQDLFGDVFDIGAILTGEAEIIESGVSVNGELTDRYALTRVNSAAAADPSEMVTIQSGDVYVSRELGIAVRVTLVATGFAKPNEFSVPVPGAITYIYDVFPNSPVGTIAPPQGCDEEQVQDTPQPEDTLSPPGTIHLNELPRPADAYDVADYGPVLLYYTHMTVEEVAAFYTTEMPALDWTLTSGAVTDDGAALTFQSNGMTITIAVAPLTDGAIVTLAEG